MATPIIKITNVEEYAGTTKNEQDKRKSINEEEVGISLDDLELTFDK